MHPQGDSAEAPVDPCAVQVLTLPRRSSESGSMPCVSGVVRQAAAAVRALRAPARGRAAAPLARRLAAPPRPPSRAPARTTPNRQPQRSCLTAPETRGMLPDLLDGPANQASLVVDHPAP